jgi:hypothetical protein
MKKNKFTEYKDYWDNDNLQFDSLLDQTGRAQGIFKAYYSNGEISYIDYNIDGLEEGESLDYNYIE